LSDWFPASSPQCKQQRVAASVSRFFAAGLVVETEQVLSQTLALNSFGGKNPLSLTFKVQTTKADPHQHKTPKQK